jgi:hypothetical protein
MAAKTIKDWAAKKAPPAKDDDHETEEQEDDRHLKNFASAVHDRIGKLPENDPHRFGAKVFASAVLPGDAKGDARVKDLLVRAHRAGHLNLTRADMGGVIHDKAMVDNSECKYGGASWHCIRDPKKPW